MNDRNRLRAAALAYTDRDPAPRVVAKGEGVTAEALIALAQEAGIYIHRSPELVDLLMRVDLDSYIPEELYVAVAELLAWLWEVEQRGDGRTPPATS